MSVAHSLQNGDGMTIECGEDLQVWGLSREMWGAPLCVSLVDGGCRICGCGKVEMSGLLCLHICVVLTQKDELNRLSELIAARCMIDD
jgi:hypothetical protein